MSVKFLVVDDEPDVELLIRHRFRKQIRAGEYDFVFAGNGEEALARLEENDDVEIVLSDINMPKMDGLALLTALGTVDRLLKVIMVSAYGDLDNIRTAMNRGAFDFVTKPIDFTDLEVTIAKSLREVDVLRQARSLQRRMGALEKELDIARRIQLSMLPTSFPNLPEFDLHGLAAPAREVGGDFYDYVEKGDNRLGITIGDVAGKGLGAALFMAISRTVMHATALRDLSVEACVRQANTLLEAETKAMPAMFVTVLYAEMDTSTGEVTYCNAGHNPPLLIRANGEGTYLSAPKGLSLCLLPDFEFHSAQVKLEPGDVLLFYTDGVTEAFNGNRDEFTEERLARCVCEATDPSPKGITEHVLKEVRAHAGSMPQSDDITMLALRYKGSA